ncbi:hypothetical protein [Bradyrhizobium huanghuaihaiense]|uniref:hypothetical protein n=1 Tax=Bradyrhizobium huanghuaihaiense TaxID=990078 RepID=UPI003CC51C68
MLVIDVKLPGTSTVGRSRSAAAAAKGGCRPTRKIRRHQTRAAASLTIGLLGRDELRRQADVFIELAELQANVSRDPFERQAARERGEARGQYAQRQTLPRPRTDNDEFDR